MPPEDDDDQLDVEDREDPEVEGLGPKGKQALAAEREARKAAAREAREAKKQAQELTEALRQERFSRLKAQHDWLEESDLTDIELSAWDQKVERWAAIAGAKKDEDPSPTSVPAEERAEMERFTKRAGGGGPAPTDKPVPAVEALAKVKSGDWSDADWRRNAELRRQTEAAGK